LKGGGVAGVKIMSEKGRDCIVQNPWPGRRAILLRDRGVRETLCGERFRFKTGVDEAVEIEPLSCNTLF
jgi:hypothetical protein